MSDETQAPEAATEPAAPKRGIGTVIREALLAGKTNEEALEDVKAFKPEANTTAATVSWYRNQLRKEGADVPTARALNKTRKAAEPAVEPVTEAPVVEADPLATE